MGYFGQFLADSMSGGQARSLLLGSGDEQRVQWSFDHWAIFAPFSILSHSLFIKRHRSHFGSRYTLGCCGHAGLF